MNGRRSCPPQLADLGQHVLILWFGGQMVMDGTHHRHDCRVQCLYFDDGRTRTGADRFGQRRREAAAGARRIEVLMSSQI